MKKNTILSILTIIVAISVTFSTVNNNVTTAYGNTFSMPDDSNSGNDYHSYNINKKEKDNMNEYNINNNHTSSNNTNSNTAEKNYDNNNNANKIEKEPPEPIVSNAPTVSIVPTNSKIKDKKKKKTKKIKKIAKIEFTKHFIKLPAGKTRSISFTTIPAKASSSKLIYKSLDNSIVRFNNKKVTGIKKGFCTIIIMLPNETVKAACPIKIV